MAPIEFTVDKGSQNGKVVKATASRDGLKADEILLENTHSGVCFTDHHYTGADMGLGHEGVGVVREIGGEVKNFKM